MDNKEVRRRNLAWLVERHGGPTLFGDAIDRAQSLVTRWVGGKNIGDKSARHIETALGRDPGWLDRPQWLNDSAPNQTENKPVAPGGPPSHSQRIDHAIITQAKRWVMAEETLAGTPADQLAERMQVVDAVLTVYELMLEGGGTLTAQQREQRFEAAQLRQPQGEEAHGPHVQANHRSGGND